VLAVLPTSAGVAEEVALATLVSAPPPLLSVLRAPLLLLQAASNETPTATVAAAHMRALFIVPLPVLWMPFPATPAAAAFTLNNGRSFLVDFDTR
jgi:hypothetical protein